jgi:hypothetical protein
VLIGADMNSLMEDSPYFDKSTCCSRSRDVSGTLSLTTLLSICGGYGTGVGILGLSAN